MNANPKILVAGSRGLVGSAICRALEDQGGSQVLKPSRAELNYLSFDDVVRYFEVNQPDTVYLAAAKVGGITANNNFPAEFIHENLLIQTNLIHAAYKAGVKRLVFLGSSCIYPRMAKQPIEESELLTGALEPTNKPYAVAKIAGLVMCESYNRQYGTNYISAMPTNLYGPHDNFHPDNSHVIPGMMRRFHEAKLNKSAEVVIWGSGKPRREFLFVDDLADALLILSRKYKGNEIINVGTGVDIAIADLAHLMAKVTEYSGKIVFDLSKPDGTPRKVLNVDRMKNLGWSPKVSLEEGLLKTYAWAIANGKFSV